MDAILQTFLQQFQHLKIQLEDITSATNKFDDKKNYIGVGGFGKVYKGEISHSKGRSMVAIKRLNSKGGQGVPEFLKEIMMLSSYKHEHLISLLGFCCEGPEMILVYEHASRGSLDRYLNDPHLTWTQRLKICFDAAKGLCYLHDPREKHQRLIHCDVKSGNILLDSQWRAKVSDFGLSIMGSANEEHSVIVTAAAGTPGYIDPQYQMTHTLTKESDVYSFGVVLFEVLCGRSCCIYRNRCVEKNFVPTWIECYRQKKLYDVIFKSLTTQPMDESALETFSDIAYRCLVESRKDRPSMAEVVIELQTALESQEFREQMLVFDYENMIKTAETPLTYSSYGELRKLLSKGLVLNDGKTWFSLNNKGEHYEMISFAKCVDSGPSGYACKYNSRFAVGTYTFGNTKLKTRVHAQLLSPGIKYTVNLVFKFVVPNQKRKCDALISISYKLQGETKNSISYLAYEREDGWWTSELYQFISDYRTIDLEVLFDGFYSSRTFIEAEGIEFRPLENVEQEKLDMQPVSESESESESESDAHWEEKLPIDYVDIMKLSRNSAQWTKKKEAYSIIRKGFLIDDGYQWFYLDKNGKKCHMLSARSACIKDEMNHLQSFPESRFGEALEVSLLRVSIFSRIQSQLVSARTTYAAYLVYKLPEDKSASVGPLEVQVDDGDLNSNNYWYIYLVSPQTPCIEPIADQNTHNPVNRPKIKGLPHKRHDGWMEVQIWDFQTTTTTDMSPMHLKLTTFGACGLIIEGVEIRPIG